MAGVHQTDSDGSFSNSKLRAEQLQDDNDAGDACRLTLIRTLSVREASPYDDTNNWVRDIFSPNEKRRRTVVVFKGSIASNRSGSLLEIVCEVSFGVVPFANGPRACFLLCIQAFLNRQVHVQFGFLDDLRG